jgi:hypothetical protein
MSAKPKDGYIWSMPRFHEEWSFIASNLQGDTPEQIDKALEGMDEFQRNGVKEWIAIHESAARERLNSQ